MIFIELEIWMSLVLQPTLTRSFGGLSYKIDEPNRTESNYSNPFLFVAYSSFVRVGPKFFS